MSRTLRLPQRTLRYRIARLRHTGFLQPFHILTNERKVGLGENIIVIQEEAKSAQPISKLLEMVPYFYWYSPTYGRYNGHLIHSVFSLESPDTNRELLRAMQKTNLVSDYHLFEAVDYAIKNMNLKYFSPEQGWTWNWNKWIAHIESTIRAHRRTALKLEENPDVVGFDAKDILILSNMVENAKLTLKQLGERLELSEAQVSKRIRRMENEGIIKGYKSVFNPTPTDDLTSFYCFLELREPLDSVLACFQQLPYTMDFLMESKTKICVRLRLSARDLNMFLKGFDLIKSHLNSYFFQIVQEITSTRIQSIYGLFDKSANQWQTPTEKHVKKIEEFSHRKQSDNSTSTIQRPDASAHSYSNASLESQHLLSSQNSSSDCQQSALFIYNRDFFHGTNV